MSKYGARARTVRIASDGPIGATVEIDGHDIANGIDGLTLTMSAGQIPRVEVSIPIIDVTEIQHAEAHVLISAATRDVLIRLGWTPPTEPDAEVTSDLDITPYLVVHRYRTDRGNWAWSWRCWGDGACDGWLALDLSGRDYADRKAREHLATEHAPKPDPAP